jgi:hypothetical protein
MMSATLSTVHKAASARQLPCKGGCHCCNQQYLSLMCRKGFDGWWVCQAATPRNRRRQPEVHTAVNARRPEVHTAAPIDACPRGWQCTHEHALCMPHVSVTATGIRYCLPACACMLNVTQAPVHKHSTSAQTQHQCTNKETINKCTWRLPASSGRVHRTPGKHGTGWHELELEPQRHNDGRRA